MALVQADRYDELVIWWRESCESFSYFYLFKSLEQRKEFLLRCAPDMPIQAAATRERNGEMIKATDLIVPELFFEGFEAGNGRCLILFLTRRLASPDTGLENDLTFLRGLHGKGVLPTFSNGSLDSFRLPFVDPLDPTETIQSLATDASSETIQQANQYLSSGKIIHAEVFLTCSVRRSLIATFISALKAAYEEEGGVEKSQEKGTELVPDTGAEETEGSNMGVC
jgi:hypothetical protein